jgi:phage head maturation protease
VQGVLIAALMIASSMMWALKAEPTLWEVSVVGALGYALAGVLAMRLVYVSRNRDDDK